MSARTIALFAGIVYAVLGLIGLFFAPGNAFILGLFPSNTPLEIVYLVTAVFLLYAAMEDERAHFYAGLFGSLYILLALIALIFPNWGVFGLFPLYGLNVALFAVMGLVLLYDWIAVPTTRRTSVS
jgi:Domain of unknown function (DUF4383)